MKKILACFLLFVICLPIAYADDLGIQIIGAPETQTETVSLDDIKLNTEVTIDGFARLVATEFDFVDVMPVYKEGSNDQTITASSGVYADYAALYMDIVNLSKGSIDYLDSCDVVAYYYYDDEYVFTGGGNQINWDNKPSDSNLDPKYVPISSNDNFAIGSMYKGHYVFGLTLPNEVVHGKGALKLVINLSGNEITYNVRE